MKKLVILGVIVGSLVLGGCSNKETEVSKIEGSMKEQIETQVSSGESQENSSTGNTEKLTSDTENQINDRSIETTSGVSVEENSFNINKLIKVKDEYNSESYSGKYLTGIYVGIYNIDNLDKDTLAGKNSDGIYDNSIAMYSKESNFNKNLILEFYDNLKNGNLYKAKEIFEKNDISKNIKSEYKISPFYPVCCSWKFYNSVEIYKNGLLGLISMGNGDNSYNFYYITTYKNNIYELSFPSGFGEGGNPSGTELYYNNKKIKQSSNSKEILNYMLDLFYGNKKDESFIKEFNLVKKEIENLY